jgi:hypothetical protein
VGTGAPPVQAERSSAEAAEELRFVSGYAFRHTAKSPGKNHVGTAALGCPRERSSPKRHWEGHDLHSLRKTRCVLHLILGGAAVYRCDK